MLMNWLVSVKNKLIGSNNQTYVATYNIVVTDICQCPNTISSSTIPIGVGNTESIEILSVCSGKPCDDSCSYYSNCKVCMCMIKQ